LGVVAVSGTWCAPADADVGAARARRRCEAETPNGAAGAQLVLGCMTIILRELGVSRGDPWI